MLIKITITFLLIINFISVYSRNRNDCDCTIAVNEIVSDIESNYPGFSSKVNVGKKSYYKKLKNKVITQAMTTTNRESCFYIIEKYIHFFKDNHIIFSDRKTSPSQHSFSGRTIKKTSGQLIGNWRRNSDSLLVSIVKGSDNKYEGYILKPNGRLGEVYFELIGNDHEFRIRNYNTPLTTDLLRGRRLKNLLIEPNGIWQKMDNEESYKEVKTSTYSVNKKFIYNQVKEYIYYLGIPSFNIDARSFDSIIVNQIIPQLEKNKITHLIIDLRNNVGGNSSFLSLMRFAYERPFSIPGDFLFASPKLIQNYEISTNSTRRAILPKLRANLGGFVQRDSLRIMLKENYRYPKTISIIVNENSASSSEYFLILAKHSTKVKLYGRHTAGTLDYSELLEPEKLSCEGYSLMRPTTKSYWTDSSPIDNKGILPDIDLSFYPDNEWVDIILDKLK
ncbi:S41 family peptidase [Pedobacter agri]|uniref:S41 family peptidase n=1 Tax=Pedobacter agri TaxID=454586 RepID=A0A9X3DGT9_9SPHI|nr:S41 family peptidase [Pedobacter agri]MCX3267499.1 S41 family peptidase [Pedobacter agri]